MGTKPKKIVTCLFFSQRSERDVPIIELANRLAQLEKRMPHDVIRQLVLDAGNRRINEILFAANQ